MINKNKIALRVAMFSGLMTAIGAHAASVVTAGVTTQLADAQTDVLTIGGAVMGVVVIVAAFKLARRAL